MNKYGVFSIAAAVIAIATFSPPKSRKQGRGRKSEGLICWRSVGTVSMRYLMTPKASASSPILGIPDATGP
jgi:hypothetical protein